MPAEPVYPTVSGPVDIHNALKTVRNSPEFKPEESSSFWDELRRNPELRKILDQLGDAVSSVLEAIQEFFSRFSLPDVSANAPVLDKVFTYTIYGMLLLFLVFLVYLMLMAIRRYLAHRTVNRPAARRAPDGSQLLSSQEHWRSAQGDAEAGRYQEAIRQVYLAGLCYLDESRIVPYQDNRTNREYVHVLRGRSELTRLEAPFVILARGFEESYYGQQPATEDGFQRCRLSYESLVRPVSPVSSPAPAEGGPSS
jgi:hypothetical protein